jgi:hypothetical protein
MYVGLVQISHMRTIYLRYSSLDTAGAEQFSEYHSLLS